MKTTIYDLLGMIKDNKAPKKIKYEGCNYVWNEYEKDYERTDINDYLFDNSIATDILNDEVEILETTITYKPDKIEKLKATLNCIKDSETILGGEYYVIHSDFIIALEEELDKIILDKINEIIDKVNKI